MLLRVVLAGWCCLCAPGAPALRAAQPGVILSEFMASNRTTLRDDDGEFSDWIELHNRGAAAVSLNGWFLTDTAADLRRWRFPAVTLQPGEFFVVFASGKNRTNPTAVLHTNFRLERAGEYLALVRPDGVTAATEFAPAFPPQQDDVSYGFEGATAEAAGHFFRPTPGGPNASTGRGFAPPVEFSASSHAFTAPFELALSAADPAAEIRYTLDGSPPGTNSPLYLGPIGVSNRVEVRARAYAPGLLPGPVRTEGYLWVSAAMRTVSWNLPVLVLDTFGRQIPEAGDLRAFLWVFEPRGGRTSLTNPPALAARIVTDRRGSSTLGQPKPNLDLEVRGEQDEDRDVPLLDLPAGSDWVLHAPYNFDPAGFRNPLAYALSRDAGRYAPRHRFAEVYLKTTAGALSQSHYHGLYNLLERVRRGPDRVDIERLGPADNAPPEVTGGYIVKVDRLNPGESGFSVGGLTLAHVYPRERVINTPQRAPQRAYLIRAFNDYVSALNRADFADPVRGYAAHLDVPAAVDHHLLNTFFYNVDALRLSTFIHKPRGGKLTWGPLWDFDRALGSTDGRDAQPRGWNAGGGTDFFYYPWWSRLFQDPHFWQLWIDRWQELRDGPLSLTNVFARIDAFNAEIAEAVPRDFNRWQQPKRGGSQAGEIAHLKGWLTNRAHFMDTNFVARPRLSRPGGRFVPGETLELAGPAGATLWYTLDGSDPRARHGGFSLAARQYHGPIPLTTGVVVRARAYNPNHLQRIGHPNPPLRSFWSGISTARFTPDRPAGPGDLAVTEIAFRPAAPTAAEQAALPGVTRSDFEFLELRNVSPETLDLHDVAFTRGIRFAFASNALTRLASGAHLVLVRNPAAFALRHPGVTSVAGRFEGGLAREGERLAAADAAGRTVLDVRWRPEWHAAADGHGFTLVAREPAGDARPPWDDARHWRPSALPGGSPGRADPRPPALPPVVVSELLTHADPPLLDFVELHNAGDAPADIGGWLLGDRRDLSAAWTIPPGTVIPPRGFVVFDERHFNALPGLPGSFAFSSLGEEVWLAATDGAGRLLGPADGFVFGAAAQGVSFGRETNSVGEVRLVPQARRTPGGPNAGPLPAALAFNEIHAPAGSPWDAFIELKNLSAEAVPLFDPAAPANTWRLAGVDFDFPRGITVPPGGLVVVTAGYPGVFRQKFGVPPEVPVLGPWPGRLQAEGERLALLRPDAPGAGPDGRAFAPAIEVEAVSFRTAAPWPAAGSFSLNRRGFIRLTDDPAAWFAAPPSPGTEWSPGGHAAWLAEHFTAAERGNPAVSGDLADPDGDGLTNLEEFIAGTHPRDARSRLELGVRRINPGWLRLEVPVQPGRSYVVESRRAHESGWRRHQVISARDTAGVAALDEPAGSPGEARFYRVATPAW